MFLECERLLTVFLMKIQVFQLPTGGHGNSGIAEWNIWVRLGKDKERHDSRSDIPKAYSGERKRHFSTTLAKRDRFFKLWATLRIVLADHGQGIVQNKSLHSYTIVSMATSEWSCLIIDALSQKITPLLWRNSQSVHLTGKIRRQNL